MRTGIVATAALASFLAALPGTGRADDEHSRSARSRSPIDHVLVVVGENHTFDNLFGVYRPRGEARVHNLLSQRIVRADGSPGPRFHLAAQSTADGGTTYSIDPRRTGKYATLPRPNTTYATGLPGNVPDVRFPADLP
ncbi:MAG: phosphoesterase, partial [Deltaproteobacteria bacterium]